VINGETTTSSSINIGLILGVSIPLVILRTFRPMQLLSLLSSSRLELVMSTKLLQRPPRLRRKSIRSIYDAALLAFNKSIDIHQF
jgi:hypothetical protein